MNEPATQSITCSLCGEESTGKARGWRARVHGTFLGGGQVSEEVAIYCPACASDSLDEDGA